MTYFVMIFLSAWLLFPVAGVVGYIPNEGWSALATPMSVQGIAMLQGFIVFGAGLVACGKMDGEG
jgi:hypothetical protein